MRSGLGVAPGGSRVTRRAKRSNGPRGRARVSAAARVAAAHRHTDAGPDRIVCLLCGETYHAIAYLHLKRVHGFEGAHPVRDYKARFGLRVAACEEVCLKHKETQIARHERAGRHWTKGRILGAIRKRRRGRSRLAHSRVPVSLSIAARLRKLGRGAPAGRSESQRRPHEALLESHGCDRRHTCVRGRRRSGVGASGHGEGANAAPSCIQGLRQLDGRRTGGGP